MPVDDLRPKDPVNQLVLELLEKDGHPFAGQPFPVLDLVLEALEENNHNLRPNQVFDLQQACGRLLMVRDPKRQQQLSDRLFRDLVHVPSARQLPKDQLSRLLVDQLFAQLASLEFSPVSYLPVNPSSPSM